MACLEAQLSEIELLLSMFPSEEELRVDQVSHAELRANVENSAEILHSNTRPQFTIMLKMDNPAVYITLSCTYPAEYPQVLPEITVRCPELTRAQQTQLHSDLSAYLSENCCGEVCVLSAVQWIQDNAHKFIIKRIPLSQTKKETVLTQSNDSFTRLWIYSHHIYNKIKRKNILEWSKELNLSGFSMPGKPGIVCVEGLQSACEEFWARVKVLTWKRVMIRHREDVPLDDIWTEDRIDSASLQALMKPFLTLMDTKEITWTLDSFFSSLMTRDVPISFKCTLGLKEDNSLLLCVNNLKGILEDLSHYVLEHGKHFFYSIISWLK